MNRPTQYFIIHFIAMSHFNLKKLEMDIEIVTAVIMLSMVAMSSGQMAPACKSNNFGFVLNRLRDQSCVSSTAILGVPQNLIADVHLMNIS
jgi:hypothetical protein